LFPLFASGQSGKGDPQRDHPGSDGGRQSYHRRHHRPLRLQEATELPRHHADTHRRCQEQQLQV